MIELRYIDLHTKERFVENFENLDEAYKKVEDEIHLNYKGVIIVIPKEDEADMVMAWGSEAIDYYPDLKEIEISYQHIY